MAHSVMGPSSSEWDQISSNGMGINYLNSRELINNLDILQTPNSMNAWRIAREISLHDLFFWVRSLRDLKAITCS